jgi:hypothetical protein
VQHHKEGDCREMLQVICQLGLDCLKETECALSLRAVKNLDQTQNPKAPAAKWMEPFNIVHKSSAKFQPVTDVTGFLGDPSYARSRGVDKAK